MERRVRLKGICSSGPWSMGKWFFSLVLSVVVVCLLHVSVAVHGQDLPTLPDGTNTCGGYRYVALQRATGTTGQVMWLKVVVWNSMNNKGINSAFQVQVRDGTGTIRELSAHDAGAQLIKKELCVTDDPGQVNVKFTPVSGHTNWYSVEANDGGQFPAGTDLIIRNNLNVFYVGIAYTAIGAPAPSHYKWNLMNGGGALPEYPKDAVRLAVIRPDRSEVIYGKGAYFKYCKGDTIKLMTKFEGKNDRIKAANKQLEYFTHDWTHGNLKDGDAARNLGYYHGLSTAAPISVKVRNMCDMDEEANVVAEPIAHQNFSLKPVDLCLAPGQTKGEATVQFDNPPKSGKIKWYKDVDRTLGGVKKEEKGVDPLTNLNSGALEPFRSGEFDNPDQNDVNSPDIHHVRAILQNGECFDTARADVRVHTSLRLTPGSTAVPPLDFKVKGGTDIFNRAPQCSPQLVELQPTKEDIKQNVVFTWESIVGTTTVTVSGKNPTLEFKNATGTTEMRTVKLTISNEQGQCKDNASKNFELLPDIQAQMSMDISPSSYCGPFEKLELHSTGPDLALAGATVSYAWHYLYKKDDGSEGEIELGNAKDLVLDKTTLGTKNVPPLDGKVNRDSHQIRLSVTVGTAWAAGSCTRAVHTKISPKYPPETNAAMEELNMEGCVPFTRRAEISGVKNAKSYFWARYGVDGTGNIDLSSQEILSPSKLVPGSSTVQSDPIEFMNEDVNDREEYISVHLVSAEGCETRVDQKVSVPAVLKATLFTNEAEGCPNENGKRKVRIQNLSKGHTSALTTPEWFEGVPATRMGTPPTHVGGTEYEIELDNNDATQVVEKHLSVKYKYRGCESSDELALKTYPMVNPAMMIEWKELSDDPSVTWKTWADGDALCAPVQMKLTASGAADFSWTVTGFEREIRSNQAELIERMEKSSANPDNIVIKLKGYNSYNCSKVLTANRILNPGVIAGAWIKVLEPCTPMLIELRDTSRSPSTALNYKWEGTGTSAVTIPNDQSKEAGPIKLSVAGDYEFKHTVELPGAGGHQTCSAKETKLKITVLPEVKAKIAQAVAGSASTKDVCAPETVKFDNASTGATSYTWYFEGKGVGKPNRTVAHQDPTIPTEEYRYENTTSNPIDYPVTLVASNDKGCVDEDTYNIRVYPTPAVVPEVEIDPLTLCSDFAVTAKIVPGNALTKCTWTFEPQGVTGQKEEGLNLDAKSGPWRYKLSNSDANNPVSYLVTFSGYKEWTNTLDPGAAPKKCHLRDILVKGNEGVVVPPKLNVDIRVFSENSDPTKLELCSGETLRFENHTTGGEVTAVWDLGDGGQKFESTTGVAPSTHTYWNSTDGDLVHDIRVKLIQQLTGCEGLYETQVTVHPEVKALFMLSVKPEDTCKYPMSVTLINESKYNKGRGSGKATTQFVWDYGYTWSGTPQRMTTSSADPHVHEFRSADPNSTVTYRVQLDAKQVYAPDFKTCSGTLSRELLVHPELIPSFTLDEPFGCIPHDVKLTPTGSGGVDLKYQWDFGDGRTMETTGNGVPASHTYNDLGNTTVKEYTIRLTAVNSRGCTGTVEDKVTTYPQVRAGFSLTKEQYCSGERVEVLKNSYNADVFDWNLSVNGTPTPVPDGTPMTFEVTNQTRDIQEQTLLLKASKSYAGGVVCEDNASRKFKVYPEIQADFDVTPVSGCSPLKIRAIDNSNGVVVPQWFVDGELRDKGTLTPEWTISNESTETARVVSVKLVQEDAIGCKKEVDKEVTIFPHVDPSFSVLGSLEGCAPFKTSAQAVTESSVYKYRWSMVGGTLPQTDLRGTGEIEFLNTTYPPVTILGNLRLDVELVGFDETCASHMEKRVSVYPQVYPSFTGRTEACSPFSERFRNTTQVEDPASATFTWKWQGQTSNLREDDIYCTNLSPVDDVQFALWLIATSKHGCSDSVSESITVRPTPRAWFELSGEAQSCPPFIPELTNKSAGTNLSFELDWGDGTPVEILPSATAVVSHRYDNTSGSKAGYVISLKATSQYNCVNTYDQQVYVYPGVSANFEFDPGDAGCSPFSVTLKNLSVGGHSYSWDFGDGRSGQSVLDIAHEFENVEENDAIYDVKLVASTEAGCKDSVVKPLTVYATPRAMIDVTPPLQYYPGATVDMGNKTSPAAPSWDYSWDFGDRQGSSTERNPGTYTYPYWGPKEYNYAYTVKYVVKSPHCKDSAEQQVFILPPPPDTRFSSDYYEACAPMAVYFTNETEYADEYLWEFGDGNTSTEREPVHVYEKPGTYHVKLTAKGEGGEFPGFRIYTAHSNPVAQFNVHPERIMMPNAMVKVSDESLSEEPIEFWEWDFGDGFFSNEESPVHMYNSAGEYHVGLKVRSIAGCEDDTLHAVPVVVMPEGQLVFPNAFSPSVSGPNGGYYDLYDTKNEVFHPYMPMRDVVDTYHLMIFNRWGETLFESTDIEVGWDGYRDGNLCPMGVYAWRAVGRFWNGEVFDMRGNVTLLR